jgi:hypothetical protein
MQVNGRRTLSLVSRCQGWQQEVPAHCIPVRIELACERNACEMDHKGYKKESLAICLAVRVELSFKRNAACLFGF